MRGVVHDFYVFASEMDDRIRFVDSKIIGKVFVSQNSYHVKAIQVTRKTMQSVYARDIPMKRVVELPSGDASNTVDWEYINATPLNSSDDNGTRYSVYKNGDKYILRNRDEYYLECDDTSRVYYTVQY